MKRILSLVTCIILILSFASPAFAAETDNKVLIHQSTVTENGIKIIDSIFDETQARSTTKTYTRKKNYYAGDTLIATIAITGNFRYDGSTVSVVSKSVSQSSTYDGWSYKQNSFTSSGGTIALDAKLTKLLHPSIPVEISLTCDKNGNISYT